MPGQSSRGRYRNGDNQDLLELIGQLETRISALERVPRLQNTGLDRGDVIIQGGGMVFRRDADYAEGQVRIGTETINFEELGIGFELYRADTVEGADYFGFDPTDTLNGNAALTFSSVEGSEAGFEFATIQINDKSGNPIFTDSYAARRGMHDPVLSYTWSTVTSLYTSTSTTLADNATIEWYCYHAHLRIRIQVQNDGGNVLEIQVADWANGGNLLTYTSASGYNGYADLIIPRSAIQDTESNGNIASLIVSSRRASGAGTVRWRPLSMVGIDLSWFEPF